MFKQNESFYLLSVFVLLLLWSSCSILSPEIKDNDTEELESNALVPFTLEKGDTVSVLTWNIKFGAGKSNYYTDCHDKNVHFQPATILSTIDSIGMVIKSLNPNIVLLQEVDLNSKRSGYINEVQRLLDITDLNYAYYVPEWKENFVPVDGLGYINSGNAILTKAPINGGDLFPLPNNTPTDKTTAIYYMEPSIVQVHLKVGEDQHIFILNTRLSEFASLEYKQEQITRLQKRAQELTNLGHIVIAGGCLYSLPPNTKNTDNFADEVCTEEKWNSANYASSDFPMEKLYNSFTPAISLPVYTLANSNHFTHSRSSDVPWNRKTDYLFVSNTISVLNSATHQSLIGGVPIKDMSDHCPVQMSFIIP